MTRPEFLEAVLLIVEAHSGSVTSGMRSRARNTAVGGHPRSRHLTGYALDVVLDVMDDTHITAFIDALRGVGALGINEGDHVHVQPLGPWGRPT